MPDLTSPFLEDCKMLYDKKGKEFKDMLDQFYQFDNQWN